MMSFDFLKALSVLGCLISLMKRELNIQTLYGMSLFAITTKTSFLSSLLIFLRCKSVNGGFCIKTDISIYGDCFADMPTELMDIPVELVDMPVELVGMPVELVDMPAKVMWFSIIEFLFVGCF